MFHVKQALEISRSYEPAARLWIHAGPEVKRPSMIEFNLVIAPQAGH